MSEEELKAILNNHWEWVLGKSSGTKADLSHANLKNINLKNTNLPYTSFFGANLKGANLSCTHLSYTNLAYTNLKNTNLANATLSHATLHNADLSGAILNGVDLTNAKNILQWQSPQGEKRICYSVKHDTCVMHKLGCHWGDTEATVEAIRKKYGENSLYERYVWLACQSLAMENNDD